MCAIVQEDMKALIAYSSVSHMSFVVLGIVSQNVFGLTGAVLLMGAHGLVSSGLFGCVGILYERYHVRQIDYYGGLIIGMPLFGTCFLITTIANFGFPLTLNFVAEFIILLGLVHFNLFMYFFASIGLFLALIYSILLFNKVMYGNTKRFIAHILDVRKSEFYAIGLVCIYSLILGCYPNIIIDYLAGEINYYSIKKLC